MQYILPLLHITSAIFWWNSKHIANANKFDHIARINGLLGLFNPKLVTPFQLLYKE
jgi:hypothetical protein